MPEQNAVTALYQIRLSASAKGPLTPALSPQARLGLLATQRARIRKRMRMGRGSPGVPAERADPLPLRERVAACGRVRGSFVNQSYRIWYYALARGCVRSCRGGRSIASRRRERQTGFTGAPRR